MIRVSPTARSIPFDKINSNVNFNNLQEAVESLNSEIIIVQNETAAVYDSIKAYRDEFIVTQSVIQNGIELSASKVSDIIPNSVIAFVDRVGLFENFDFQLINGPNDKVKFNFLQQATDIQNGFVEGGEYLRIHYLTRLK